MKGNESKEISTSTSHFGGPSVFTLLASGPPKRGKSRLQRRLGCVPKLMRAFGLICLFCGRVITISVLLWYVVVAPIYCRLGVMSLWHFICWMIWYGSRVGPSIPASQASAKYLSVCRLVNSCHCNVRHQSRETYLTRRSVLQSVANQWLGVCDVYVNSSFGWVKAQWSTS